MLIALTLLLASLCLPASARADIATATDGRVDEHQWKDAQTLLQDDHTTLLALPSDRILRFAVQSDAPGILSVWIAEGDRVRLLHASAAVGEGFYEKDAHDDWNRTRDFRWDRGEDAAARRAHFEARGWTASITPDWDRSEREFAIDLDTLAPDARIAISYGAGEHFDTRFVWPAALEDDTRLSEMQRGDLPERACFDTDGWSTLDALSPEQAR